jgi:hypothetical protein
LEWLIVPSTWPLKIGVNVLKEEMLAIEDTMFPLHQSEPLSPC